MVIFHVDKFSTGGEDSVEKRKAKLLKEFNDNLLEMVNTLREGNHVDGNDNDSQQEEE